MNSDMRDNLYTRDDLYRLELLMKEVSLNTIDQIDKKMKNTPPEEKSTFGDILKIVEECHVEVKQEIIKQGR